MESLPGVDEAVEADTGLDDPDGDNDDWSSAAFSPEAFFATEVGVASVGVPLSLREGARARKLRGSISMLVTVCSGGGIDTPASPVCCAQTCLPKY